MDKITHFLFLVSSCVSNGKTYHISSSVGVTCVSGRCSCHMTLTFCLNVTLPPTGTLLCENHGEWSSQCWCIFCVKDEGNICWSGEMLEKVRMTFEKEAVPSIVRMTDPGWTSRTVREIAEPQGCFKLCQTLFHCLQLRYSAMTHSF